MITLPACPVLLGGDVCVSPRTGLTKLDMSCGRIRQLEAERTELVTVSSPVG
jgi:hypothetical protein